MELAGWVEKRTAQGKSIKYYLGNDSLGTAVEQQRWDTESVARRKGASGAHRSGAAEAAPPKGGTGGGSGSGGRF